VAERHDAPCKHSDASHGDAATAVHLEIFSLAVAPFPSQRYRGCRSNTRAYAGVLTNPQPARTRFLVQPAFRTVQRRGSACQPVLFAGKRALITLLRTRKPASSATRLYPLGGGAAGSADGQGRGAIGRAAAAGEQGRARGGLRSSASAFLALVRNEQGVRRYGTAPAPSFPKLSEAGVSPANAAGIPRDAGRLGRACPRRCWHPGTHSPERQTLLYSGPESEGGFGSPASWYPQTLTAGCVKKPLKMQQVAPCF